VTGPKSSHGHGQYQSHIRQVDRALRMSTAIALNWWYKLVVRATINIIERYSAFCTFEL
jgi:hypothetical protein